MIISMLAKIEPRVYVFNLDTGYQFRRDARFARADHGQVRASRSIWSGLNKPVAEYEAAHGGPVYQQRSRSMLSRSEGSRAPPRGGAVSRPGPPAFAAIRVRRGPIPRLCNGTRSSAW